MSHLFCFGLGYSASRVAKLLASEGWSITGTARTPEGAAAISRQGYDGLIFDGRHRNATITEALADATHVLVSVPPGEDDPVLRHHETDLRAAPLRWLGYLSTVGVYGDRQGGWVDETGPADTTSLRGRQRVVAEAAWLSLGKSLQVPTQLFRLAGIYGPGRSAIDKLRDGTAHRIVKPGQVFNRIHVDDIARTVRAGIAAPTSGIYNVTDDEPAPPQDVVAYAADLLGVPPPPEVPFADADLSPMATSFYSDNKRVANTRLHQELGIILKFPTYREGLRAILAQLQQQ